MVSMIVSERTARLLQWNEQSGAALPAADLRLLAAVWPVSGQAASQVLWSEATVMQRHWPALAALLDDPVLSVAPEPAEFDAPAAESAAASALAVEEVTPSEQKSDPVAVSAPQTVPQSVAVDAGQADDRSSGDDVRQEMELKQLTTAGIFAPYDLAAQFTSEVEPAWGKIVVTARDDRRIHVSWLKEQGVAAEVLYRLVTDDDAWPTISPDAQFGARLLAVTRSTDVLVSVAPERPVTYFAVWINEGHDEAAARRAQPRVVARGQIVWPVRGLRAASTPGGYVAGQFTEPGDGVEVEVQRSAAGRSASYEPGRALPPGSVTQRGFMDADPVKGVMVTYAAYVVATLPDGSTEVSESSSVEAMLEVDALSLELTVTPSADTVGAYDLSWIRPGFGRVGIYLLNQQPPKGIADDTRSIEVIERAGFLERYELPYPTQDEGPYTLIKKCHIDPRWTRGYFAAVHVVSPESVGVGPTVSVVNPRAPEHVMLIERVDTQILTFAWPEGMTMVELHQGPRGQIEVDPSASSVIESLTYQQYRKMGGLHLKRPLPPNGCSLHLFGVVYDAAVPQRSTAASLDYAGITRVRYQVVPVLAPGAVAGSPPVRYHVEITTDDVVQEVFFALVHNRDRLPLFPGDGHTVHEQQVSLTKDQGALFADLPVGRVSGFLRLMVTSADSISRVAVLDPAPQRLRVSL